MCYQDEQIVFHRCDPKYQRATVRILRADHNAHIRTQAKKLSLIHLGDNIYYLQRGRDSESVIQGVEAELADYEAGGYGQS